MHGVTHTIHQIRERGVPGYEVEVIGTDADVDRRLSAVAEIDIPFYRGLKIGVPTLPAIVEALAEGRYDLVHLCSPARPGIGAWLLARVLELPVIGSYHTELAAYAGLRCGHAAAGGRRRRRAAAASTAPATSCSRPAPPPTSGCASWGSPIGGSGAGTAASTSSASIRRCGRRACSRPAGSTSSTRAA